MDKLRFMMTSPHPCSYFDDREAATIFVDPDAIITTDLYGQLSRYGFRRSGDYYYRPECPSCEACVPTRVPVERFQPKRGQKRTAKNNTDLSVLLETDISQDEYFSLYERYINQRHSDGDMYPPSRGQYDSFLGHQTEATRYACFRDADNKLLAVAVLDVLPDGVSAVYTFFDPEQSKRSLGTYAILWQIEFAKAHTLPYLYLGYWIKENQKMNYKTQYRPLELLLGAGWMSVN